MDDPARPENYVDLMLNALGMASSGAPAAALAQLEVSAATSGELGDNAAFLFRRFWYGRDKTADALEKKCWGCTH